MTDKLTAALDEIRERRLSLADWGVPAKAQERRQLAHDDVPRLLAALDAVLGKHKPGRIVVRGGALCAAHENHRYFSITAAEARAVDECPDCPATTFRVCDYRGDPWPCPEYSAISAALLGEESQ